MNRIYIIFIGIIALALGGCFGKVDRVPTNYYVLDYQPSTEKPELRMNVSNGKSLYVMNSRVSRTYNRNQIVAKENFYRVRFMQNDLWANRLSDAIPNIVAQRLRSYNIFSNVSRDPGAMDPNYYLETNVLNIEKVEGSNPRAFLKMEFVLRDSTSEKVVFTHRNERYHELSDNSIVYLVQVFNNMIMEETNTFAAMCIMHFAGRPIHGSRRDYQNILSAPEQFFFQQLHDQEMHLEYGELLLSTKAPVSGEMPFRIEQLDSLNTKIAEQVGEFNNPIQLNPGRYRIVTGYNEDIHTTVEVFARQRTVVSRNWSELKVRVLDLSQNKVRQIYDLWRQNDDDYGYTKIGSDFSLSDDEHGMEERLWILPSGTYMITLGGFSWSDLRDFATIKLAQGDSQILTVIVDPSSTTGSVMVGAGVLADELGVGSVRFHKGAVHGNINLSSNNDINEKDPTFSLNLAAQFDNTIEHDFRPFHYALRSIYDLGANISTGSDFKINLDTYSLKNVFMLYPWGKQRRFLNNFAFYGRADLNTHFWDEYTYFSDNKNYIIWDADGSEIDRALDQAKIRTKIALFPLRLKEGTGITYRIAFSPNGWVSLRGGYGWQQRLNHRSLSLNRTDYELDGVKYDVFSEAIDQYDRGIETTLVFSAVNVLNFFSINSTVDALFPIMENSVMPRIESENRINFRIYRNVSMDFRVNLTYDEAIKDWLVYDYSTYLRMSLFY